MPTPRWSVEKKRKQIHKSQWILEDEEYHAGNMERKGIG